ncbi:MAG: hypothetical protein KC910_22155 [Candidatus Eremiobacteraeota bacterium]|nr:hypothetical protein [Candidatus Eremiobacteraeota bacterium]
MKNLGYIILGLGCLAGAILSFYTTVANPTPFALLAWMYMFAMLVGITSEGQEKPAVINPPLVFKPRSNRPALATVRAREAA